MFASCVFVIPCEGLRSRLLVLWLAIGCWIFAITPIHAWNAQGHQLIAQIALQQLTPQEKKRLSEYSRAYQIGYQPKSLRQAAAWLDWMQCHETWCQFYPYYHYIDYPYCVQGALGQPPRSENAVVALQKAHFVLQDPTASKEEKGLQLRVLMHVVGDIHQPLHTISRFSPDFPQGDQGGNRFKLGPNRIATQLHAYWDRAGGYLVPARFGKRQHMNFQNRARQLLKRYPCPGQEQVDFSAWARASYELAKTKVYQLTPHQKPTSAYRRMVVRISQQQLALAGCRLGTILKQL